MIFDLWLQSGGNVIAASRFALPGNRSACWGLLRSTARGLRRDNIYAEVPRAVIAPANWKRSGYSKTAEFMSRCAEQTESDFAALLQCFDEVRNVRNASLAHYEDDVQQALAGMLGRSYRLLDPEPPASDLPALSILIGRPAPSRYDFWELSPCASRST